MALAEAATGPLGAEESRLAAVVRDAAAERRVLHICGGGSKDGLGGAPRGEPLSTVALSGIVDYDPAELVVTVRAGTRLADLQAELARAGQMLPFEPPEWGGATVGGVIASGLSGPRRPFAGSVRDALLGVRLLDGRGEVLRFGGRVMKNVAGFDLFRPQVGAWGRLGVVLEASFRLLPLPEEEASLRWRVPADEALARIATLGREPLPVSGAAWADGALWLRLSGTAAGVDAALRLLDGERASTAEAATFWGALRDQRLPGFAASRPVWRLVLPSTARSLAAEGEFAIDWAGGLRWLASDALAEEVRALAASLGGHASAWRGNPAQPAMHPLDASRAALHRRLFEVFDPRGVFDHGRFDAATGA